MGEYIRAPLLQISRILLPKMLTTVPAMMTAAKMPYVFLDVMAYSLPLAITAAAEMN
jgi:hypothetical protein